METPSNSTFAERAARRGAKQIAPDQALNKAVKTGDPTTDPEPKPEDHGGVRVVPGSIGRPGGASTGPR